MLEMGLSLRLSSLFPWGLGDRMDRGNEGPRVENGAIPETLSEILQVRLHFPIENLVKDMLYAPINGMPHYPPPGVIGGR